MEAKTGTKITHEKYGEGVITSNTISGFTATKNCRMKIKFIYNNTLQEVTGV